MDVEIKKNLIQYHIIGGVFHMKFFFGDKNPEKVIEYYHEYLGKWILHPFWTMGFI